MRLEKGCDSCVTLVPEKNLAHCPMCMNLFIFRPTRFRKSVCISAYKDKHMHARAHTYTHTHTHTHTHINTNMNKHMPNRELTASTAYDRAPRIEQGTTGTSSGAKSWILAGTN